MMTRFEDMGSYLDRLDENLQTFQVSYDRDMYNLDTCLQSMWVAQQA